MNENSKRIFAGLLTACFLFVHVLAPVVAFEIEHSHHGNAEHDHDYAVFSVSKGSDAESDDHDHAPIEQQEDEDDLPNGGSPSHTHFLSLSVDIPSYVSGSLVFEPNVETIEESFRPERESCPGGPSFEVMKPPQLV